MTVYVAAKHLTADQLDEKETEEEIVKAYPIIEDVNFDDDDDFNDFFGENRTNGNKSAEL